jgi:hypothetical protein
MASSEARSLLGDRVVIREELSMDLVVEDVVDSKKSSLDPLRLRLERVLELVQLDRPEAAAEVLVEVTALERLASGRNLGPFNEVAAAAVALVRRWQRGTMTSDDARIAVLRLTLAMIRELAARRVGR